MGLGTLAAFTGGATIKWRLNSSRRPAPAASVARGTWRCRPRHRAASGRCELADPVKDIREIPGRAIRVTIKTSPSSNSAGCRAMIAWNQGEPLIEEQRMNSAHLTRTVAHQEKSRA